MFCHRLHLLRGTHIIRSMLFNFCFHPVLLFTSYYQKRFLSCACCNRALFIVNGGEQCLLAAGSTTTSGCTRTKTVLQTGFKLIFLLWRSGYFICDNLSKPDLNIVPCASSGTSSRAAVHIPVHPHHTTTFLTPHQ